MTFREFMAENGYTLQTTFWSDFSIADRFGLPAVQDTFNRAFAEWKKNYKYLTELILSAQPQNLTALQGRPGNGKALQQPLDASRPIRHRESERQRAGILL